MTVEQNKSIIRRYLEEAYNKSNISILDELCAPNYTRYLASGAVLNLEQQKQRLAGMRAAFPDLCIEIVRLLGEENFVTLHVVLRGTHRGGTFMGVEPSGHALNVPAFDVVRLENGKMVEHWGGADTGVMVQQLKG